MSFFKRAHDIVEAKANRALDKAENPSEMLDLSYEQMLEQITKVRAALVQIAAARKQLELQEDQFKHTIDHLNQQAAQAVQLGREDLAREALSRKAAAQEQIDGARAAAPAVSGPAAEDDPDAAGAPDPGQRVPLSKGNPEGAVQRGSGVFGCQRPDRRDLGDLQ